MKYNWLLIFTLITTAALGQDIVLKQKPDKLYEESLYGPNKKHFMHLFLGMGFYLPGAESDAMNYWSTNTFHTGLRYKYKISNTFSTGLDLHYKNSTFNFNKETQIIQDNRFYDKEKMIVHGVGSEYYFRINFDTDRGNYVGNFVDLGFYMEWLPWSRYITNNKSGASLYKEKEEIYKNLKRLEDFEYGISLKMAKNKYVLFINYRLSDLFDDKYGYVELPRATVGLLLGLHN